MSKNTKEYQREASRKHYLANKESIMARSKLARKRLSQYVAELKASTPCKDCNQTYPSYVMDFDHLPEHKKVAEIPLLIKAGSSKKLMEEIKKCDIVCSNCHRIRTHTRRSSLIG